MRLFLKTFLSTVAVKVGLFKRLRDVATVLLDLVCLSFFCFYMQFQMDSIMVRSVL